MNKIQNQTIEILKQLVEKQKSAIDNQHATIIQLEEKLMEEGMHSGNKDDKDMVELADLDLEEKNEHVMECGIGRVGYTCEGSLQLTQLMESLESAIKKHNALYIEQVLDILANQ